MERREEIFEKIVVEAKIVQKQSPIVWDYQRKISRMRVELRIDGSFWRINSK